MGENSGLRVPLRNCFLLIAESIRRERRSQFRRCDKVSAGRMPLAGRQDQVGKFATCANGQTAPPNCPWLVSRIICIAVSSYPLDSGSAWDQGDGSGGVSGLVVGCRPADLGAASEGGRRTSIDANEKRSAEGSGTAVYIWVHRNKGTWRDMRSALQSAGRLRGSNLAIRSSAVFPLLPRNRDRCIRGSVETRGALMRTTVHKSSGGTIRQGNPSGVPLVTTIKADLMSRHVPLLRWTQFSSPES